MSGHEVPKEKTNGVGVSAPNWREKAMGRVVARQRLSSRATNRSHGMYIFMDDPMKALVDEAAFRRGISMAGYIRRALGAMIAHDLGLTLHDVVKHSALPNTYEQNRFGNRRPRTQDDAEGFGDWKITGLE